MDTLQLLEIRVRITEADHNNFSKKAYAANDVSSQNDICCLFAGEADSVSCFNQWQQECNSPASLVPFIIARVFKNKMLFSIWLPIHKMNFFLVDIFNFTFPFLVNLVFKKHNVMVKARNNRKKDGGQHPEVIFLAYFHCVL